MRESMQCQKQWKDAGKKRKGGEGAKGAAGGPGTRKTGLDAMSVGYYRRVSERLSEGFADDEEKAVFVQNVLGEVKSRAVQVATDMTGSVTLEKLVALASPVQVGQLLAELGGDAGSQFKTVSCERCGGHVMESALRQVTRWTDKSGAESEDAAGDDEDQGAQAGNSGILEAQVLLLCEVVKEQLEEFICHTHGSHVVRTLIHVLGGCLAPARPDTRSGGKTRTINTQLQDFEAPPSFSAALKMLCLSLLHNISVCVRNVSAGAVMQSALAVCHRKQPKLCRRLTKGITGYISSLSSAPGVSPLLVFLKDQACSRLIESVFQFSHKALLRDLYKNHLQGHLVTLAVHPIANFPLQRLTAASARCKVFVKVFNELKEGVEAILAAGHMGVIVQMAQSCEQWEELQGEVIHALLTAFHCGDPPCRRTACLPLFLSLLTHEVYYGEPTGEANTQRPLSGINYHGSMLVQALVKFKERSLLVNSLRLFPPSDLLTLGTDQSGSHVLQALLTSASDKGRGKILKRMEGQFVKLVCSRFGSRVLEAVWNSATISQKQSIAQELVPSEAILRSDQFARHVWAKFALSHFVKRKSQWQEVQTNHSKKMKLFSDILQ